uniref:Peroxisomal trans-2-enoyl-CoA reductase n=1 Tax=Ixodes ricinus TaxID=34613 RepID=A0A6B0V8E9_IXORI
MSGGVRCVRSIFRPGLFKHKVAVVTGGATGIGKAVTEELLHLGCSVTIASRNEENLKGAANELQSRLMDQEGCPRILYTPCNIRSEEQVKNLISRTLQSHNSLDERRQPKGGGQRASKPDGIDQKGCNPIVDTNLTGTSPASKEAYSQWMEKHGGSIVNIIMENERGYPLMAHSGAARAGVENLTRSLAIEWAESGVRINAVAPGVIYSATAAKNYATNVFDLVRTRLAAKRTGTPQEVSSAVCFLLSSGASYVSGTTLFVDAASRLHPGHLFEVPEHDRWPEHDSCIDNEAKELP